MVFVNRNHFAFKLMLHYIRNNMDIPEIVNHFEWQIFLQELEFWEIPIRKLTSIEKKLIKLFNSKPNNPLLIPNVME
jgi:hypothetical protein